MPTVAELATWLTPQQFELAGGRLGLGRDVARVVPWSPERPGITLHDGDVVVVRAADWRDVDNFQLTRFVDAAAGLGIAAVMLLGEVDRASVRVADDRDVAVLSLAREMPASQVERLTSQWLAERLAHEASGGRELREELSDLAQAGGGEVVLLEHLATLTRKVVVVHEVGGTIQHLQQAGAADLPEGKLRRALGRIADSRHADDATYHVLADLQLAALTTLVSNPRLGAPCLSLVGDAASFTGRDRAALRAVALTCRGAAHPASDGYDSDEAELISLLMLGDDPVFEATAEALQYDLHAPHVGFAVQALDDGLSALRAPLTGWRATYRRGGDRVYGLVSGRGLADQRTRERLMADVRRACGGACVGYSAVHAGPRGMRRAVVEALKALRLSAGDGRATHMVSYTRLCVDQLLEPAGAQVVLDQWRERVLEPLLRHDQFEPPGLVATLEAFLDNACVTLRTAEVLNCHRNSVVYRLQRIREIVDVDLDDADTRLLLQLMLRSARLPQSRGCVTPAATS